MKNILGITIGLFLFGTLYAEDLKVKSKISYVTVYRQGAQIERSMNVQIPKGKTDIYVENLSSRIDERSIQATAGNGVMIMSVNFNIDYMNPQNVSREVEILNTKRKQVTDSLEMIGKINQVYLQEKEMILANKSIGGNNGVSINELKQSAMFFRERLTEIEMALFRNKQKTEQLSFRSGNMARQLQTLNAQMNKPTGVVKITVSSSQPVSTEVKLKYLVNDASWVPGYDIRIQDVDSPLDLFYKAQVFQNTGEEWNNVKLTLSTGNPSLNNTRPVLQTYFLTFNNYYAPVGGAVNRGMLSGRVIDNTGMPLPGVNVLVKGTTTGTVTDIDGRYSLALPENAQVVSFSYIGFTSTELAINNSVINVTLNEDAQMLDEVVVTGFVSKKASIQGSASNTAAQQMKQHIPLAIQQQQVSTEFRIELPYTIPSDNKPYDVTMVEYRIPAQYQYSCVPKLSSDVFLMAQVPDWTGYNLQNGEANLFFQGVYQGKTYIDTRAMEDTLSLSIGRDKDIIVERKVKKDYQSRKTIGSTVREQKTWELVVKNNKNIPVRLVIEDQYPISRDSEIKVDDLQYAGAKADTDKGVVIWNLQMKPKASERFDLSYTVKYPKNRKVLVE